MMPGLLVKSPPWVRGAFSHNWAPMAALAGQARLLPARLLTHLLANERGYVAILSGESRYVPGSADYWGRDLSSVACVAVEDLARGSEEPLHVVGHMIDHLLGCGGRLVEPWLTDGGGVSWKLREAGERLRNLFDLGYGIDEVARDNVRDYFAQSLALYCLNRKALNVADPQITKWFRSTLWSKPFWSGLDTGMGD